MFGVRVCTSPSLSPRLCFTVWLRLYVCVWFICGGESVIVLAAEQSRQDEMKLAYHRTVKTLQRATGLWFVWVLVLYQYAAQHLRPLMTWLKNLNSHENLEFLTILKICSHEALVSEPLIKTCWVKLLPLNSWCECFVYLTCCVQTCLCVLYVHPCDFSLVRVSPLATSCKAVS